MPCASVRRLVHAARPMALRRALSTAAFATEETAAGVTVTAPRKKAVLVDGNNLLYHFFDPLSIVERDGIKTSAVDGLLRLLKRMDRTHEPEHINVVFDSPKRRTTRKVIDPNYKIGRRPMPPSLRPQFAYAPTALQEVHVNTIEYPGFEADDIIASYSAQYVAAGFDVLVISNDNDFLQLVHDSRLDKEGTEEESDVQAGDSSAAVNVQLYQPSKRKYIRERHLKSRFGLRAHLLPDLNALCGHRWGKIPKVDNMSDELAVRLLTQYGGVFQMLRQLDTIEDPVLRRTLKHSISSIETSHRMAKLRSDVPLPVSIDELQRPQLHA